MRLFFGVLIVVGGWLPAQAMKNGHPTVHNSIKLPVRITIENPSDRIYYAIAEGKRLHKNDKIEPGQCIHYHTLIKIPTQPALLDAWRGTSLSIEFDNKSKILWRNIVNKAKLKYIFATKQSGSLISWDNKDKGNFSWYCDIMLKGCHLGKEFALEEDRSKFREKEWHDGKINSVLQIKINLKDITKCHKSFEFLPLDEYLFSFDKIVAHDLDAFKKIKAAEPNIQETFLNGAKPLQGYKDGSKRSKAIEYQYYDSELNKNVNNLALVKTAIAQCRRNSEKIGSSPKPVAIANNEQNWLSYLARWLRDASG